MILARPLIASESKASRQYMADFLYPSADGAGEIGRLPDGTNRRYGRLAISGDSFLRAVLAETDNLHDLGAVGASRFRDLFLTRHIVTGGAIQLTQNVVFDGGLPGRIQKNAANGLLLQGVTGTTNDFAVSTPNGQRLLSNPTGTETVVVGEDGGDVILASLSATAVSVGANDTGGGGFKVLRVPN